jgi:ABC-2 type transport system permease protein
MSSLVNRGDLIKKINIPRYLVVVSSSLSTFINLGLNLIVVGVFALLNHLPFMKSWVLLPFIILELFIFSVACGFFLSALYVKYRDALYVWEVILQAGFYATPILYPLTLITNIKYQQLMMLNPMAQMVQDARWAFVSHQTLSSWKVLNLPLLLVPFLIVLVSVIVSILYFKAQSKYFAENI